MNITKMILVAVFACFSYAVQADCKINITVKNTGDHQVQIINATDSTGVKTQGGFWRSLNNGYWLKSLYTFWLNPEQKKGDDYTATFGCRSNRQYRVLYYCEAGNQKGSSFTTYYPSATEFTTDQTLTINIGKLCNN